MPLTDSEKKRLEDFFKSVLISDLGSVPSEAMEEFRSELDAVEFLPYESARRVIESLAKEIVRKEIARREVVPPEIAEAPLGLEKPLSILPFPRSPSSEEETKLWKAFTSRMREEGRLDWPQYAREFKERIWDTTFKNWADVIRHFNDYVDCIITGKPLPPLWVWRGVPPPLPWRKGLEGREDAIVHFTAVTILNARHRREEPTLKELRERLDQYGVSHVTHDEIKTAIKEALKRKDSWFTTITRQELEKFLAQKIEGK